MREIWNSICKCVSKHFELFIGIDLGIIFGILIMCAGG